MRKEPQCVDPLGFAVPREEFFIESYVAFRIDASCGSTWSPLDGAVDGFVLEVFVDVAAVAGDPCSGVQLSTYRPRGSEGSEKRYIDG